METEPPPSRPATALREGVVAILPLMIGVIPFGFAFGVAAAGSGIDVKLAWSTSPIIFAGAAQLATVQLLSSDTSLLVVAATGLMINLRHVMYSAVLASDFRRFPRPWRVGLPYLLTDQTFAMAATRFEHSEDPSYKRWYYLGVGMTLWVWWQATTALGIVLGAGIPSDWNLDFAIPAVFLALLVLSVKSRPGLVAAAAAATVATLGHGMPYGLGLVTGIGFGIAAGVFAERWWRG
ncbi:MAG TPA: AzlC family ABC transporter permease [Acidimicrobiia bacterium]|jgi:4-azaleucine resistance transporter AzlC